MDHPKVKRRRNRSHRPLVFVIVAGSVDHRSELVQARLLGVAIKHPRVVFERTNGFSIPEYQFPCPRLGPTPPPDDVLAVQHFQHGITGSGCWDPLLVRGFTMSFDPITIGTSVD